MKLDARTLDRQLDIERPIPSDAADGAGSGTWAKIAEAVWAEVQDVLPSRVERRDESMNVATRRARVRMRYRDDVTAAMRFVMGGRIMTIMSGPAEIGRRDGVEFLVEDYSSSGNAA